MYRIVTEVRGFPVPMLSVFVILQNEYHGELCKAHLADEKFVLLVLFINYLLDSWWPDVPAHPRD